MAEFDMSDDILLDDNFDKENLMVELISFYASCGAPSHRCEEKANRLFVALGIQGSLDANPSMHTWSFDQSSRTVISRLEGSDFSLRGVEDVEAAVKRSRKNPSSFVVEARQALSHRRDAFPLPVLWIARGISPPLAVAVFFGGTFKDMAAASVCGTVVALMLALMSLAGKRSPQFQKTLEKIFPCVVGFVVALLSRAFVSWGVVNVKCCRAVELGTIVDLLPGVSITLSVLEMAAGRSVSGIVRLFQSLITAFLLGFGLAYGNLLSGVWSEPLPSDPVCPDPIDPLWTLLFLPLQLAGYAVQLNAPIIRWPAMFLAGIVSWSVTFAFRFVPPVDGGEGLETAAASFAVGLVGGLAEKITRNRTSSMSPILEGILILVPGSVAVLSLANAIVGNVSSGLSFGLRFLSIAVSITVGLFLAGTLFVIPWKKSAASNPGEAKYLL